MSKSFIIYRRLAIAPWLWAACYRWPVALQRPRSPTSPVRVSLRSPLPWQSTSRYCAPSAAHRASAIVTKKVSVLPVDNHFARIQLPPVVCCQKPKLWCQKMKTKGPSLRLHALHKRPGKLAANLKQKQIHPHRSGPPAPNPFKHLTGSQRNLVSNLTSSLGGGSFVNGPINEKIPSFHAIRSRRIAFKRKTNSTAPAQSCRPKVGPGRSMTWPGPFHYKLTWPYGKW